MWKINVFLILTSWWALQSNGSNILILPVTGHSHIVSLQIIGKELVRRGHQVTVLIQEGVTISKDLESNRSGMGLERYMFGPNEEKFTHEELLEHLTTLLLESETPLDVKTMLRNLSLVFGAECTRLTTYNEPLFDRLEAAKFDIAIVDAIFFMKCGYLVAHRLGVPWITYSDALNPFLSGVPMMSSFVPHAITTFTDKMTFYERLQNTAFTVFFGLTAVVPDPSEDIMNRYRTYGAFDSLNDLESRSLLWFTTRDILIDYPRPSMPNIVDLGGLTVSPAKGEVTKELDEFMSIAKKGTILVTFGSNVVTLPSKMAQKFLVAFGKLEGYQVIWRLRNKDNLEIPKNVKLATWLPQNDLLADQRIKLFVTHSGNNGQLEAICHGVPMIGFPLFGDQEYNARRLPAKGYGIWMSIREFTVDELVSNILKIANNATYKQRAMRASKIFKSRRETAAETAAYWIEHVIQFGGDHLRSGGRELNYFQYYMLDIIALILLLGVVLLAIMILICRAIFRKCVGKKTDATKRKSD